MTTNTIGTLSIENNRKGGEKHAILEYLLCITSVGCTFGMDGMGSTYSIVL